MTVIIPLLYSSMMLGLTFDLGSYRKGHYEVYDLLGKSKFESNEVFTPTYKIVESSRDVREVFGIDARLAILMKLDHFGNYLSNLVKYSTVSRNKYVEILIGVKFQQTIESIPENVKPSEHWKNKDKLDLGSHYVKRIRRGGVLLTTMIFYCKSEEQKQKVLKSLLKNINQSGTFDFSFIEKINAVEKELGDDYPNFQFRGITCLGCITADIPVNIEDMVEMAEELPMSVNKTSSGKGFPIQVELEDIADISDFPPYEENKEVIAKLDEIEELFDDVIIARNDFIDWKLVWSLELSPEDDKKVHTLYNDIERVRRALLHSLVNLNISPESSVTQFDEIYKEYGTLTKTNDRYRKRFRELQEEIESKYVS